jgi:hypothetical protein
MKSRLQPSLNPPPSSAASAEFSVQPSAARTALSCTALSVLPSFASAVLFVLLSAARAALSVLPSPKEPSPADFSAQPSLSQDPPHAASRAFSCSSSESEGSS